MRRNESLAKRREGTGSVSLWSVVGGAALLIAAAVVIISLPDIKRYIKISTM